MNLQFHLLSRIVAVALACLMATTAYVLYRNDWQVRETTQATAESLGRQLEIQLLRIDAGFGQARQFPDFSLWKQTASIPGICVRFEDAANPAEARGLCNGARLSPSDWPKGFEKVYRRLFNPGFEIVRPVAFKHRVYGSLTVASSVETDIAQAWDNIGRLLGLSAITTLAVCALVYLSINRALLPAKIIVAGLETIGKGNLAHQLPTFELHEWKQTAAAINQLTASQQRLLEERQKLAVKLINLQEEERRYLARELHDEFGQCLAALNAVAASIAYTAEQQCPALLEETDHIARISRHMMDNVRRLLGRLRPAELSELGLAASLNSLVAGWNTRCKGRPRYRLVMTGDCALLPESLAIALFRTAQECLTNIAKHSRAENAEVRLAVTEEEVTLTIQDDGIANQLPFAEGPGIGLLGIRERLTALRGGLTLATAQPHGLIVKVGLPTRPMTEAPAWPR
jgi:two-component system sensor histidine kinase UhpB